MTAHDTQQPEVSSIADDFVQAVLDCQQSYWGWADATDEQQREAQRHNHTIAVERLFALLKPELRRLTHRWTYSSLGQDEESLIGNAFNCIYQALPTLRINLHKNLRRCLITIAQRGLTDRYWEDTGLRRRLRARRAISKNASPEPTASDYDSSLLPAKELVIYSLELVAQDVYAHYGSEDAWIRRMYVADCMKEVLDFWQEVLSVEDQVIIQMRWVQEPQASFKEIAQQLGPGWTDSSTRQRNKRILDKTRAFLREQGWLDDDSKR